MVFRQLGEDTDIFIKKFGIQIGQFKKSLKDIGKDFNSGLGLRSLTGFITKKDLSALNDYAQAIQNGTNYAEAFKIHLSKVPIEVKRQANKLVKLVNQQKLLNKQYQEGKILQQDYKTQMAANKAQIQAITIQTGKLTLAQKASAVASKAAGIAMNLALNVGLMFAINLIIAGITKLVNKQKELREAAIDSAEQMKEQAASMDELISEYEKILESEKSEVEKVKDDVV